MPKQTDPHRVYRQVRDAILTGRFKPGAYLRERELAAKLGVSRTPIREALRQLERDGQVRLTPRVGAAVREVSVQDLLEVLEMRRCLEPRAARIAASRIDATQEACFKAIQSTFEKAAGEQPLPGIVRRHIAADRRLHELILELAGNRRISQAVSALNLSIQRYRYFGISHRFHRSAREHLDIIGALLRRDPERAEAAMAHHLDQFTLDVRALLLPGSPTLKKGG